MKRSAKIGIGVGIAVVVVVGAAAIAGPIVYRDFISGTPDAVPTVAATTPAQGGALDPASPAGPVDLSGEWTVGDGSFAGYRVKEVLNGTDVTVTGRTEQVSGTLTVEGTTLTAATISVDVGSIATEEPSRDAYFRDSALQVDEFPTATFDLTSPVTASSTPTSGEIQTVSASGDLTIHGVTRPVTVELQAVLSGTGGQVSGSIPITFSDFGVEAPSLGFVTVEDTGSVEFLLDIVPA
ncbi:YceI family protein [Compostimonas suwonensis]|uniref:Polyisoprenoid-binding protein YceI n=1 Tax=Compostimonas suwonensis TaxID=1048394 RepID=A0A2M9BUM2_9MICO|nr:YceI family protein [Compostimonas suwonensis]PJJ61651.1 polyisoprenoid-binding protein YceI [Compostimonas suwonensis]